VAVHSLLVLLPLRVLPLHLGTLHAHERLLVLLIAFGPFVVLAAVVLLVRRRDLAAERAETVEEGAEEQDAEERNARS